MRVVGNENDSRIRVGDIVQYGNVLCWVVYDGYNVKCPIRLVALTTGEVVDGFKSVCELENTNTQLYSKSDRVVISFDS